MTAAVVKVVAKTTYSSTYESCVLVGSTKLIGIAVAMPIIIDVIVCGLTLWNALFRRRVQEVTLLDCLMHDGFFHFIAMLFTRLFAVLNTLLAPSSQLFLGLLLCWTLITVVLSRLTIQLRSVDDSQSHHSQGSRHSQITLQEYDEEPSSPPPDKYTFSPYQEERPTTTLRKKMTLTGSSSGSSQGLGLGELKVIDEELEVIEISPPSLQGQYR